MSGEYAQGIRRNWRQFALQIMTVFAVGLTMGSQRNVVPIMGEETFGVESLLVIGSFVVSFGIVKAVLNLYSGKWAETYGRKPILIAGWVAAIPIPFILIFAPGWSWIAVGNVLLGVNQGVAWSMSMISKIELAGPDQRGLAAGLDEAFGYTGVAVGAWLTGVIAAQYSLRPEPFYFLAAVIVVALLIATVLIEETLPYAKAEAAGLDDNSDGDGDSDGDGVGVETDGETSEADLSFIEIVKRATYKDRTLFTAAQAGHVENFVDTLVWIAFPIFLIGQGLDVAQVGVVVGVHSAAYFLQVYTGRLGDRVGRKPPIVIGFFLAGAGVLGMVLVEGYYLWILFSALSGVGMALHYPNLIAVASDAAHPLWRSTGLGVYRLWRDLGYAVGAILIGLSVDLLSIEAAFYGTAIAMFLSGGLVVAWMEETHPGLQS
ncbi:major facilitator superfamily transport protein (plasmid) [Natrialba magadii ATCC 43099]|uniref:Major facilitator superfamily protein n=1 Tax=Natrialba magadii (strain ATCC 43099 / DSM 3394 / CCM 3739 / CIP 104546 / IAM 13178 / JCM 8861 / NBRC 102185 / NCIMB 2190 / MS3) TaxID=547559 RepID=D3T222_NATMM|nr:MFS transporter [Natrialba magadii]ADD07631.1 major facilitator superfamily transport protein [Natrialba magadii ATCC 43099]ELY27109.1 major facilitator superfamily protein [Natrialba magadii ATCC 43099]